MIFFKKHNIRKNTVLVFLLVLVFIASFSFLLSSNLVHAQEESGTVESCFGFSGIYPVIDPYTCWKDFLSYAGGMLLMTFGWILWLAGMLLNVSIDYAVIGMAENISSVEGINTAWRTFRDIANMFFIFIILYIAIGTILRLDSVNTKKLLVHVVIIALLLNFSLFFTKVIIDASNIAGTFFIEAMPPEVVTNEDVGLSGAFMRPLGLTSVMDGFGSVELIRKADAPWNIFLLGFMGSILFLVVAFIFFAASILLIIRALVLSFLMILSPLAFAAMALPKDEYSKKWWGALFSQAIWMPVFFALLWVSLVILRDIVPQDDITAWTQLVASGEDGLPDPGAVGLLRNFLIVIGLAVFSLIGAKQIGAIGGSKMVSWGKSAADYIGGGLGAASTRTAMRGVGMRKLYEKAGQTSFFQRGPQQALMESTLGALVKKPIKGKSVMQAYKEDVELRSRRESIQDVREARKEVKNLQKINNKDNASEQDKKNLKDAKEALEKAEAKIKGETYSGEMTREERIMNEMLEEQRMLREELANRGENEEPAPVINVDSEKEKDKDDKLIL